MPKDKDLKRLVRARMEKTGESYTSARAHLLSKRDDGPKLPDGYEDLAGQRDETVLERTGADWAGWVTRLDELGCAEMSHGDIAKTVGEHVDSGWWAQTITVGYERLKGLRDVGQKRSGEYEANKSKTLPLASETLFEALRDETFLAEWLDTPASVRHVNEPKSVRLDWPDETRVVFYLTEKGPQKTTVAVQHIKLDSSDDIDVRKAFWSEQLPRLASLLG